MYLSRLHFNPSNPKARQDLESTFELHRTLCSGFDKEKRPRLLFRRMDRTPRVFLVSELEPDFEEQIRQGRLLRSQTKSFSPKVRQGLKLRFQLRANPTRKKDGKRLGIECPEEQMNWLKRKGDQHGFKVLGGQIVQCDVEKTARSTGKVMVHLWADFQGQLEVVDVARFEECLKAGIGSAKAFGYGLLMISG